MKTNRRRNGISQSMDLFIIIAAVLGVGGIVSASVYSLVNSATANTSIAVVGASFRAGAPSAISVSVKNDGGTPIDCSGTSCEVVVAGTSVTSPACSGSCLVSGGHLNWTLGGSAGPLTFYATGPLSPGEETSFVVNGPMGGSGTFWSAGEPVTLNVLFGSASAQITVVSQ